MLDSVSLISIEKPIVKYQDMHIYQITSFYDEIEYNVIDNGECIFESKSLSDCINYILEREIIC